MSRLKTSRRLARVNAPVVAALFVFVSNASHGTAYLAVVGPPELRFAPSHERGPLVPTLYSFADSLPKIAISVVQPEPKHSNTKPQDQPEIIVNPVVPPPTNAIVVFPASTNNTVIESISPAPLQPLPADGQDGQTGQQPGNGVVTPEMLLNYLKPAPSGTGNAAQSAEGGAAKFSFVPPTPVTDSPGPPTLKK